MFTIKRVFFNEEFNEEIISTGLTLEEAKEHYKDKESSSRTCSSKEGNELTEKCGPWFDCYEEE